MGTGKKEATRRERQGKSSDGMSNVRTKGENFYRSAKRVKTLNMYKQGKARRNSAGDIIQAAAFQDRSAPVARVEPHRKWFTNTRVISQEALASFRGAVEAQSKDPYSYLLKQNKLPMTLIRDGKEHERRDGLVQHRAKIRIETEGFGETFGPKAQRKRPRLAVSSLDDLAAATDEGMRTYRARQAEAAYLSGALAGDAAAPDAPTEDAPAGDLHGEVTTAREPVFSKGQSKRIWNELYKVIDSSDVVVHVLDARDPLGTRCRSVEKYIREEAPHKHLLFLLNKCDLVPTSVAVSLHPFSPFLSPHPPLSPRPLLPSLKSHTMHPHAIVKSRSASAFTAQSPWSRICYAFGRPNLTCSNTGPLPLWHGLPEHPFDVSFE